VRIGGRTRDLRTLLCEDAEIEFLTFDDRGRQKSFLALRPPMSWHRPSSGFYPQAKLTIGPAIDQGFYYDFDMDEAFTPENLQCIEAEMQKIIKENYEITRYEKSRADAIADERAAGETYKVELIEALDRDAVISFYKQGEFWDLCAGPHIMALSAIKAFKLLSIAGAYWRGDEKNKMLQRIYGISFPKKEMLDEYLAMIEEAKNATTAISAKTLICTRSPKRGQGSRFSIQRDGDPQRTGKFLEREHKKRGYDEIKTPIILDRELWRRSGHWDNYKKICILPR
jgi:threonyl-tRNA synthetase